ncbi:hypothetical protein CVT26_008725, partial [Gymnopilus dilepis]
VGPTHIPFNPASKILQSQFTKQTNQPYKKRKGSSSGSSSNKRSKSQSSGKKIVKLKLAIYPKGSVFVNETSSVPQPRPKGYSYLVLHGYMRSLELREDATTLEIDAAIRDAFTDIQGRLEYPLDGWRLLMKIDGDQGESGRLRFYRQGSEVTWFHIDNAKVMHRQPQYSKTIFIALSPGAQDLPIESDFLTGVADPGDTMADGVTEDNVEEAEENLAGASESDFLTGVADPGDTMADGVTEDNVEEAEENLAGASEDKPNVPPPSSSSVPQSRADPPVRDDPPPAASSSISESEVIKKLYRLSVNICQPKKPQKWWPTKVPSSYRCAHESIGTVRRY